MNQPLIRSSYWYGLSNSGFHRLHYTDWGDEAGERVVICAHGLSRNCRDFDFLAAALANHLRVVCPDTAGRGRSDWLANKNDYAYPQYLADINALLGRITAHCDQPAIYWVGTSMGGILGMLLAALPGSPIRKLVINDVGPVIPAASLQRIGAYLGHDPRFKSYAELEAWVRTISAPFGALTDAQWHHLVIHGARQHDNGDWGMSYDPDIAMPFRQVTTTDIDLWPYWDAITCPTLLLRGADSDLLRKETAAEMQIRGPRPQLIEFPGIGHAPVLMDAAQISAVRDFLLAD